MPIMKGFFFAVLGMGISVVALSAASPTTPLKAVAPAPTTNPSPAPKQESVLDIKKKAEAGDAKAQVAFGDEFMRLQRFTKAEQWYSQAAAKGEPAALFALAELYSATRTSGTNTIKANLTNMITLHKLAAAQGHGPSHMRLGVAYKDGNGVRKDVVGAYTHLKLADATPQRETYLNQLITEMTQEQIAAADKAVAAFKPATFEAAFAELVFDSVRVTGIFGGEQDRVAMINGKQLNAGQQFRLNVGGINTQVKLADIAADGVFISYGVMERKIKPKRL